MQYPLGMSAAEIGRLRRQHETWRDATEALWRSAGFATGQTIVDLGCGPGFTSIDLLKVVGRSGRVVAVDASTTATDLLREEADRAGTANLEIITADVRGVNLGDVRPDGIFARWLFCYLQEPVDVLTRVTAHLQPGGAIAIIDYWNYLAIRTEPASPLFTRVFTAVYDSFRDAGGSLDVAGALPGHLAAVGMSVRQVDPISAIGRPGSAVWAWISEFQALYLPLLVERGYLTAELTEAYLASWTTVGRTAGACVFAPPMRSIVAVKPGASPSR